MKLGRITIGLAAELLRDLFRFEERLRHLAPRLVDADPLHQVAELLPVLGDADRVDVHADHVDAHLLPVALLVEDFGEVERRLPAHRREHRVGLLDLDDLLDRLRRQLLEVDLVGHDRVGHDRGRVRVDEDDAVAFFAEGLRGLAAGVVELAGLPDDDGAAADEEDLVDVGTFGHES